MVWMHVQRPSELIDDVDGFFVDASAAAAAAAVVVVRPSVDPPLEAVTIHACRRRRRLRRNADRSPAIHAFKRKSTFNR